MYQPIAAHHSIVLGHHELDARRRWPAASFVRTPLDLIQVLERAAGKIDRVIVPDEREDVVAFLRDAYPAIRVTLDTGRAAAVDSLTPAMGRHLEAGAERAIEADLEPAMEREPMVAAERAASP